MAQTSDFSGATEALVPLADARRVFHWHGHASLWFSLGVGLLVMQLGAYRVLAWATRPGALGAAPIAVQNHG